MDKQPYTSTTRAKAAHLLHPCNRSSSTSVYPSANSCCFCPLASIPFCRRHVSQEVFPKLRVLTATTTDVGNATQGQGAPEVPTSALTEPLAHPLPERVM